VKSTTDITTDARTKRADLLSSAGAGALGAGIALLFANALAPYAFVILLIGLMAHAWGMFQKHQLERKAQHANAWWAELLYWLCWAALVGLFIVIMVRHF
jgi:hypothetical protein